MATGVIGKDVDIVAEVRLELLGQECKGQGGVCGSVDHDKERGILATAGFVDVKDNCRVVLSRGATNNDTSFGVKVRRPVQDWFVWRCRSGAGHFSGGCALGWVWETKKNIVELWEGMSSMRPQFISEECALAHF